MECLPPLWILDSRASCADLRWVRTCGWSWRSGPGTAWAAAPWSRPRQRCTPAHPLWLGPYPAQRRNGWILYTVLYVFVSKYMYFWNKFGTKTISQIVFVIVFKTTFWAVRKVFFCLPKLLEWLCEKKIWKNLFLGEGWAL